jgi:hypothetical protein
VTLRTASRLGAVSLAPFIRAALIGDVAKNDDLLYVVAAALTFLGPLGIVPVKKVTR